MNVKQEINLARETMAWETKGYNIYPWSNELLKYYYNLESLDGKKALCITGSGDHPIHAVLQGATKVDCIDINPLAKRYSELKIALIKAFNHRDFFSQFVSYSPIDTFNVISANMPIRYVKRFLSEDAYYFWKRILDKSNQKDVRNLFRADGFEGYDTGLSIAYANKEKYELLRKKIRGSEIRYYDANVLDYALNCHETYDAIFLSNVFEKLQSEKERLALINGCVKLLSIGGVLYDFQMNNSIKRPTNNLALVKPFEKLASDQKVYVYKK